MSTTDAMREAWYPPCKIRPARFTFHSGVAVTVDTRTVPVWETVDRIMRRHGYFPRSSQTWGYHCRKITGGEGYSLHAFGIAIDVNSLSNPYGKRLVTDMPIAMIEEIEAIRTVDGVPVVGWGGRYRGNKDAMHFEVICTPAQLARGLSPTDPQTDAPVPTPEADVPQPHHITDELAAPPAPGGKLQLRYDGGVVARGNAEHLGDYRSLRPEQRQEAPGDPRGFYVILPHEDGVPGHYRLVATDGSTYRFPG